MKLRADLDALPRGSAVARHARGSRGARAALSLGALLVACARRTPPEVIHAPATDGSIEAPRPPLPDVPHVTVGPGAQGPWRDARLVGAAASPAVWAGEAVRSVVALPARDGSHARMSWVRWGPRGAEIVAQADVPAMEPGAAIALHAQADGWVALWRCRGGDAGLRWCAQALGEQGFVGDARDATASEQRSAVWSQDLLASRRPERADLLPGELREGGMVASMRALGRVAVLTLDGVEVLRAEDLRSYAPALAVASAGAERWVALSRGRCHDTRVELWSVRGSTRALRASFPVGGEVGFRWMRLEVSEGRVLLSWYQDLIPIRLPCARPDGGMKLEDHGVRVARVVP